MPNKDTISSNMFNEFFEAYEKGETDFAVIDGKNSEVIKVRGGPLNGLEDFALRVPILSSAFLTSNGTQIPRGFRHLQDGHDLMRDEQKAHFQYSGFWFYFSMPSVDRGLGLRLGLPEDIDAYRAAEFSMKIDKHFKIAYEKEPRGDARKPLKFTQGHLLYNRDFVASICLADPKDSVFGKIKPYWRSYRNLMIKPVLRTLGETFRYGR